MARRVLISSAVVLMARSAQAITVAEAPGTSYPVCSVTDLTTFGVQIFSETTDCATKASYDWNSIFLPTDTERKQLCACTPLMQTLEVAQVPHCGLYRGGAFYTYKQFAEYAFKLCTSTSTTPSSTTTQPSTTTKSPILESTPAPTVPASSSSSSSRGGLFSGVGIAILIVVGVVWLRARKRRCRREAEKSTETPIVVDVVPVAQPVREELSPLDGGYNKFEPVTPTNPGHRPTPSAPAAEDMA